jgi:hypothetical protein
MILKNQISRKRTNAWFCASDWTPELKDARLGWLHIASSSTVNEGQDPKSCVAYRTHCSWYIGVSLPLACLADPYPTRSDPATQTFAFRLLRCDAVWLL